MIADKVIKFKTKDAWNKNNSLELIGAVTDHKFPMNLCLVSSNGVVSLENGICDNIKVGNTNDLYFNIITGSTVKFEWKLNHKTFSVIVGSQTHAEELKLVQSILKECDNLCLA